jgi:succinate dehydrogenase / fumarate reductase iron-sulfur subunit
MPGFDGLAQNSAEACPRQIPLTTAIIDVSRDVMAQAVKDLQGG